jgi:LDH2 family malate/lactate/ureidoglycolate dehydrogenase
MIEIRTFEPEALRRFSQRVFEHFGVPETDARLAASILQAADLRGIDSHGVARLGSLVDDSGIEALGRVVHVLIAPSPAATSSLSLSKSIVDRVGRVLGEPISRIGNLW